MRYYVLAAAMTALSGAAYGQADTNLENAVAGTYQLEDNHAWMTFAVSHGGLSDYVVNFTDFDATLTFDPANIENNRIDVTIDPSALNTHYPNAEKKGEWENELAYDAKFFNANTFGEIRFVSTGIEKVTDTTGKVTGDLTFLGVTKPITLDVTYNGTGGAPWFGDRKLIGFDAEGVVTRSDFGMTALLPNIGDDVTVRFSGEFLQAEN